MSVNYPGDLAKPIPQPVIGLLATDEQISEIAKALVQEKYRRMLMLFDLYGVSNGNWESLCFALAEANVPGLRMAKGKSGAPIKWHDYDRAMLVLAVENTKLDVTAATKTLAQQEPWKSMISYARGAQTLRDEYYRADERAVSLARDAQAFYALSEEEKKAARKLVGEY